MYLLSSEYVFKMAMLDVYIFSVKPQFLYIFFTLYNNFTEKPETVQKTQFPVVHLVIFYCKKTQKLISVCL